MVCCRDPPLPLATPLSLAVSLHDAPSSKRCIWRNVFYVYVNYFVLIIWELTIFNKCVFDVANVGRSIGFIGRDGFYKSWAIFYRTE